MKRLQSKWSLGGADEACGAQTEQRARRGPTFLPCFGVRLSFGPQIVTRRGSNAGTWAPSVLGVKAQLCLSGLH